MRIYYFLKNSQLSSINRTMFTLGPPTQATLVEVKREQFWSKIWGKRVRLLKTSQGTHWECWESFVGAITQTSTQAIVSVANVWFFVFNILGKQKSNDFSIYIMLFSMYWYKKLKFLESI